MSMYNDLLEVSIFHHWTCLVKCGIPKIVPEDIRWYPVMAERKLACVVLLNDSSKGTNDEGQRHTDTLNGCSQGSSWLASMMALVLSIHHSW